MIELKVTLDPNSGEASRKRTAHMLKVIANAHFTSDDAPVLETPATLAVRLEARPTPECTATQREQIIQLNTPITAAPITEYIAPEISIPVGVVTEAPQAPATQAGDFTVAQVANATNVDKSGLPWDRRIHSDATERLTKEGYWKRRRNIDDATVATVEAELRALMAIPAAPVATFVPQEAGTYTGAVEVEGGLVDTDTGEFTPSVPTPPAPPAPPAPAATKPVDFAGFMRLLTPRIQAKELTHVQVNEALAALDLKSVPQLAQRTDLIPSVVALLGL